MNRKLPPLLIIALGGCLTSLALAGEAPSTELPPAPGGSIDASSFPAALVARQTDPAIANMTWKAVVERFPEIVEGPERDGVFIVAIALRGDGSVVASDMRYLERSATTALSASQRELADTLPADSRQILGGLESMQRKAAVVPGGGVLKGEVRLIARMVASNWDASRDSGIVRRAVLAEHAGLLLPQSGDHINQLTVVMSEQGRIAQHRIDPLTVEQVGRGTRIAGGCGGLLAGVPPRSAAQAMAVFAEMGLEPDQTGLVGMIRITLPPDEAQVRAARPAIGADGIARGSLVSEMRVLNVCYAWPRRPGEPVGGVPAERDTVPQGPGRSPQSLQVHREVERYFPDGSALTGNWMLLTHDGQVVRTGHVALANDETLTNGYLERMFPGIRINGSMSTSRSVRPKVPGQMPLEMINVKVMFLAPDSPLPPPEDVPGAAE